jgi:hypothetical protein
MLQFRPPFANQQLILADDVNGSDRCLCQRGKVWSISFSKTSAIFQTGVTMATPLFCSGGDGPRTLQKTASLARWSLDCRR